MAKRIHPHSLLSLGLGGPEEGLRILSSLPQSDFPIQSCIAEGLISGLLQYLSKTPSAKRKLEARHIPSFTGRMLGMAAAWTHEYAHQASTQSDLSALRQTYRRRAHAAAIKILSEPRHHPAPYELGIESDAVTDALKGYVPLSRDMSKRIPWLKEHLPHILQTLRRMRICTYHECKRCTEMPTERALRRWTITPNIGALRNHILAHFHVSTLATIARRLSS